MRLVTRQYPVTEVEGFCCNSMAKACEERFIRLCKREKTLNIKADNRLAWMSIKYCPFCGKEIKID